MPRRYPPKQFPRPRTCGGKNCYTSKHEAEIVKDQQEVINPELELSVYKCSTCRSWHLTRTKRAE